MLRNARLACALLLTILSPLTSFAQTAAEIAARHSEDIVKPSRQTIAPVIDALAGSGDPMAAEILTAWANKGLGIRKADNSLVLLSPADDGWLLRDLAGHDQGEAKAAEITELKPNAGVRGLIQTALVAFTLSDPDPAKRRDAVTAIARDGTKDHLAPLRTALLHETDPQIAAQKARLERLLTIRFDPETAARLSAIEALDGDIGLDLRASLNPLVATTRLAVAKALPDGHNIARELRLGHDLSETEAYDFLVSTGEAPPRLDAKAAREALIANIEGDSVAGFTLASLNTQAARDAAYSALESLGKVPLAATDDEIKALLAQYRFYDIYAEPNPEVTTAAAKSLSTISQKVALMQSADLALDAMSLASIYFLAAIGLAITFGAMGVINMAHGEFIMMGAYTGYVVQLFVPDYTVSVALALPMAFALTFGAGVALERLVIRHLYKRPLETLLATFGVSIALQQLAKNIFGTQARPLTAPSWLDGQLAFNDVIAISYIRIAIFVMALVFMGFILYVMRYTRFGLQLRAVQQNRNMAGSMGINPDRVNMLAFGLGSGIAGIAGVAIGLFAKVTSELGSDYIVQSFMTVVVGGVGNLWGTLAGALMIGSLQKLIEWLNPSNTLAAQTWMILFIILFIQFRPRGIIALKGRAAGD